MHSLPEESLKKKRTLARSMDEENSQRPVISKTLACRLLEKLYGHRAKEAEELNSFADRNFLIDLGTPVTVGDGDRQLSSSQFILKIYNSKDSLDGNRVELAVNTMAYLWQKGFSCPLPITSQHGKLLHLEKIAMDNGGSDPEEVKESSHMVVLLNYLPGQLLSSLEPVPPGVFYDCGRHLANFHTLAQAAIKGPNADAELIRLVKDFEEYDSQHPSTYCSGQWSPDKLSGQRHLISLVEDSQLRMDFEKTIDLFDQHVVPVIPQFRRGIIHGDFNEDNIIVSGRDSEASDPSTFLSKDRYAVSGIIDFGEVAVSCLIYDLAITVAELMLSQTTPGDKLAAAAQIISGYMSAAEVPAVELKALFFCIVARNAQHVILSHEARDEDPTNEYIMEAVDRAGKQVQMLLGMPKNEFDAALNI
ncbi:hydroxylysine kinase-like [Diadema antillarum]|uniref:hydroxylysine kinase-like n=1 Tax=Diadema antillarum TaxID=105358 RepID=UPI003A872254